MASELEQQGMHAVNGPQEQHLEIQQYYPQLLPSPPTQMNHRKIALVEEGLSFIQT